MKLYKYRPLNELLFKELAYHEIFFASYDELNDPLDLNAGIDFMPRKSSDIAYLLRSLYRKVVMYWLKTENMEEARKHIGELRSLFDNRTRIDGLVQTIYAQVTANQNGDERLTFAGLKNEVHQILEKQSLDKLFRLEDMEGDLVRLSKKFLQSSYVTCFSEINDNFLMWSHYASKHMGICLEFTIEDQEKFLYEIVLTKEPQYNGDENQLSGHLAQHAIYTGQVRKVTYNDRQAAINFFAFAGAFENEDDVDLVHLTKSHWHGYAHQLEQVFCCKTSPWNDEKEWRAIEINFDRAKTPEERTRHYPIESLSAIYFGLKTPQSIKNRIAKIYKRKYDATVRFLEAKLVEGRTIKFQEWSDEQE